MGLLKVPSTSILSQSKDVLGDGEATKRKVTGRPDWRSQQVRLGCFDKGPYSHIAYSTNSKVGKWKAVPMASVLRLGPSVSKHIQTHGLKTRRKR